ncbi:MAG: AAA family ATPase [Lactobacillales bacterium]|nr:AAA family ATPase [Lactobacillales bacterium]
MATIHFMHGFIGFGKTTIAKRLETELPAVRLNNDEWVVALYGRGPHGFQHPNYLMRIDALQWELAREIIRTGTDVILDYGFWKKSDRKELVTRALAFADRVVIHNVKCDMNTARNRCIARTAAGGDRQLSISQDEFDALLPRFEPMLDDEGFEVITYNSKKE